MTHDNAPRHYDADLMKRILDKPQGPGPDPDRRALAHDLGLAVIGAQSVGMCLGQWAGRGDYAKLSQEIRDRAGARGLAELDVAIAQLHAVRERLAGMVDETLAPGVAWVNGDNGEPRKVFVPYVSPGEIASAAVLHGHARAPLDAASAQAWADER